MSLEEEIREEEHRKDELHRALERPVAALERLLERYPPEAFERKPAETTWSARENLAHLALYHVAFLARLERILSEDTPAFGRYRAEEDSEWPAWRDQPLPEIVRRFHAQRRDLDDRLAWMTSEQMKRKGKHPAFGEMDVAAWLDLFLAHEGHHLYLMMLRLGGV
jgi:uncharacterized damage-inducible protein DinB